MSWTEQSLKVFTLEEEYQVVDPNNTSGYSTRTRKAVITYENDQFGSAAYDGMESNPLTRNDWTFIGKIYEKIEEIEDGL